jgi:hypothetical protein
MFMYVGVLFPFFLGGGEGATHKVTEMVTRPGYPHHKGAGAPFVCASDAHPLAFTVLFYALVV